MLLMSLTCAATLRAQDSLLPLPVAGPELPVLEDPASTGPRFLKPSKSITPPVAAVSPSVASALQPQVNVPTVARLRRLILMPGGLPPETMREQIAAVGRSRQPVTALGMTAPAPVLAKLADLFGSNVNDDTQKKVIDAVRQGMSTDSTAKAALRRVEVVGWAPGEGVMTVVVYPES
jgi:hypothetical protein